MQWWPRRQWLKCSLRWQREKQKVADVLETEAVFVDLICWLYETSNGWHPSICPRGNTPQNITDRKKQPSAPPPSAVGQNCQEQQGPSLPRGLENYQQSGIPEETRLELPHRCLPSYLLRSHPAHSIDPLSPTHIPPPLMHTTSNVKTCVFSLTVKCAKPWLKGMSDSVWC